MSAQFSRRDFFKVAGASSAVAVTTPAAIAGDIPEKWRAPKCTGWSWEKPVEPIPEAEVKKTVEVDVVVIGAGLAGVAAAVAAREEGAEVALIEKTKSWGAEAATSPRSDPRFRRSSASRTTTVKSSADSSPGVKAAWTNAFSGCLHASPAPAWTGRSTCARKTTSR